MKLAFNTNTGNIQNSIVSAYNVAAKVFHYLISLRWLVTFASCLREVGSNVSESAFMLATIYVSINYVAHTLVTKLIPDTNIQTLIVQMCDIAFTILLELILFLSLFEVWKHIQMASRGGGKTSIAWAIAYGIPVLCFLVMATFTLVSPVTTKHTTAPKLPDFVLVTRALAGFGYCIVEYLHSKTDDYASVIDGVKERLLLVVNAANLEQKEHEKAVVLLRKDHEQSLLNHSKKYDEKIDLLDHKNAVLQSEIDRLNAEISAHKTLLSETKRAKEQAEKDAQKGEDAALQAYSSECITWLKSGIKSASVEEISRYTGHSKTKILNRVKDKSLQKAPRQTSENLSEKTLILISSLVEWLKENQPTTQSKNQQTEPLHLVV